MIINHNLNALNAHRNMGVNNSSAGKAMEKLSSGLRINRAGDDAAGLAISEKMRGQIRGLDQASRNSQDGISLIQTAEGALSETHSILQRMRELAVQSSNDTNVTVDRAAIQEEIDALTQEIDRISKDTEFNTQSLLDGSFANKQFQIGANTNQDITVSIGKMDGATLGLTASANKTNTATAVDATVVLGPPATGGPCKLDVGSYTIAENGTDLLDATGRKVDGVVVTLSSKTIVRTDLTDPTKKTTYTFTEVLERGQKLTVATGDKATINCKTALTGDGFKLAAGDYEISGTKVLRNGKDVGTFDSATKKITVEGVTVDKGALGFAVDLADGLKFSLGGQDVTTASKASGAIKTINTAIETVSTERAKLGAVQNRLEHTINNLNTSSENLTAAESRVRDVDMAKEMMNFSKNNILNQAAQAMLAQANQQPQNVLQLLR